MNVAFIQNAEHDVHGDDSGNNQPRLGGKRILEGSRRSLESSVNAGRQIDVLLGLVDGFGSVAKRSVWRQIERNRHHRELPLMVYREGRASRFKVRKRAQRNGRAV